MIKAAFFDIDGTLIPHGQLKMPDSTIKALTMLKEKGVKVFIATGRPATNIANALNQFDFDGYVSLNGQYCVVNNQVVRDAYIEPKHINSLLPYIKENNISCIFAEKDYVYVNEYSDSYKKFYHDISQSYDPIDDIYRTNNNHVYQLMIFVEEKDEKEIFNHLPGCKSARWHPVFMDVIPHDGGKNKGIDAVLDSLNITLNETIAFGDGGNDIDMLKHVGIGVAMGNANDRVKKAADYITTHDKNDGIYNALKHFDII